MVGVVAEVVEDSAATKLDFAHLKGAVRNGFVELKAALRNDLAELSRQIAAMDAKLDTKIDTKVAMLETSIANATVQMVPYTGGVVAAIAAATRLSD